MALIGIAVAAPVGAMGVLCIQRTLARGWRAGFVTGLGIATADAFYAGCAAFGVAALSSLLVARQTPLRLVGGAFLIYLGVRSVMTAAATGAKSSAEEGAAPPPATSLYASAGYFSVPRNIMCSKKCANPESPGSTSFREPARTTM